MSEESYVGFRIILWLFTFIFTILNFGEWVTKDMNMQYRRRGKMNGWWFLIFAGFLIYQSFYWSLT